MKRFRGEPEHSYWQSRITALDRARLWWGFAALFVLLGWLEWRDPEHPPFTGRWNLVRSFVYAEFGANGLPVLYCLLGAAAAAAGWVLWRRHRRTQQPV